MTKASDQGNGSIARITLSSVFDELYASWRNNVGCILKEPFYYHGAYVRLEGIVAGTREWLESAEKLSKNLPWGDFNLLNFPDLSCWRFLLI